MALQLLEQFDLVATSHRVSEAIWLLATGAATFSTPQTTPITAAVMKQPLSAPAGQLVHSTLARCQSQPSRPMCNPPMKGGRLALNTLPTEAKHALREHSHCDRRLYQAALRREAVDLSAVPLPHEQGATGVLTSFRIDFRCKASPPPNYNASKKWEAEDADWREERDVSARERQSPEVRA